MFSLFDLYEGYFSDEINNLSDTDKKIFNDLKDDIKKIRDNEFKMAKLSKLKAILKAILYVIPAICTCFQYKDISENVTHPFEKLKNDSLKDMHNKIVKQVDNISKTSKKNLEQK